MFFYFHYQLFCSPLSVVLNVSVDKDESHGNYGLSIALIENYSLRGHYLS